MKDLEFNLGSDARLAGQPYDASKPLLWKAGWRHVAKYYGRDAKWPVKPLVKLAA